MKFFIDFDDVLFNTKKFKKDLIDIFIKNGVSEKQFIEESYWGGRYNLDKQVEAVERKYKIDGGKLRKELKYFFEDLSGYVFSDVINFLEKIDKKDLVLISYGDKKIQTEKIKQAGLYNYFNQVVITHDKARAIAKILKERINITNESAKDDEERIYFLDDRIKYIEEVKKSLPFITTVLLKRVEGRYHDKPTKMVDIILETLNDSLLLVQKESIS